MYRIGTFSKLCKLSVKALRFYEAEGLLRPARVDGLTGYRYYDSSQLHRVHRILGLRQCGFSIPEIAEILDGGAQESLLAERRRILEEEARRAHERLAALEAYVKSSLPGAESPYQVVVKDLPRVLVYSKRFVTPDYRSYFELIPAIGREVLKANPGLRCQEDPPYCFIMYHDGAYRERDIDVEYCEAVLSRGVETGGIRFKVVEAVPQAACVMHRGPYEGLRAAYAAVFAWIESNGYEAAAQPRESYIDGIWNRESPSEWLTEVQVPLRRDPRG